MSKRLTKMIDDRLIIETMYHDGLANQVEATSKNQSLRVFLDHKGLSHIGLRNSDEMIFSFILLYHSLYSDTMPFGLENTGAAYQRMIAKKQKLLNELDNQKTEPNRRHQGRLTIDDRLIAIRNKKDHARGSMSAILSSDDTRKNQHHNGTDCISSPRSSPEELTGSEAWRFSNSISNTRRSPCYVVTMLSINYLYIVFHIHVHLDHLTSYVRSNRVCYPTSKVF